jgi:hypothetical protein
MISAWSDTETDVRVVGVVKEGGVALYEVLGDQKLGERRRGRRRGGVDDCAGYHDPVLDYAGQDGEGGERRGDVRRF